MNQMKIDVLRVVKTIGESEVFEGGAQFSPIELNEGSLEFISPVAFKLKIENIEMGIRVSGKIESQIRVECYRCLKQFDRSEQVEISEVYRKYEKDETQPPEGEKFEIEDESIDVSPLAEQAFLLALPVKILCDKECKGLCPNCGKDLNKEKCDCKTEQTDPRWSKLKDFFK